MFLSMQQLDEPSVVPRARSSPGKRSNGSNWIHHPSDRGREYRDAESNQKTAGPMDPAHEFHSLLPFHSAGASDRNIVPRKTPLVRCHRRGAGSGPAKPRPSATGAAFGTGAAKGEICRNSGDPGGYTGSGGPLHTPATGSIEPICIIGDVHEGQSLGSKTDGPFWSAAEWKLTAR
jgi:hypothetical protein